MSVRGPDAARAAVCPASCPCVDADGGQTRRCTFPPEQQQQQQHALLALHTHTHAAETQALELSAQPMQCARSQDRNVRGHNGGVPSALRFTLPPATERIYIGRVVPYVGCTSLD